MAAWKAVLKEITIQVSSAYFVNHLKIFEPGRCMTVEQPSVRDIASVEVVSANTQTVTDSLRASIKVAFTDRSHLATDAITSGNLPNFNDVIDFKYPKR